MKVLICTPSLTGTTSVSFTRSIVDTVKLLTLGNVEVAWKALSFCNFIHLARDKMVREFLATDYTDLVFIDDDMGWQADGLVRMLLRDVEVIGAICPKKKHPIEWAVNLLRDESGNRITQDGMIECAYVGSALLRIRRDALDRLKGRFFDAGYEDKGFIGEDAWFCREFRRQGGRIWAEQNIKISHTGLYEWSGSFRLKESKCQLSSK